MRLVFALLTAALLAALPLPASAQAFVDAAPAAPAASAAAPAAPVPLTDFVAATPAQEEKVQPSARAESVARDAREERQFAQRGSFWWLVGVIVIAGVLLAVLLD